MSSPFVGRSQDYQVPTEDIGCPSRRAINCDLANWTRRTFGWQDSNPQRVALTLEEPSRRPESESEENKQREKVEELEDDTERVLWEKSGAEYEETLIGFSCTKGRYNPREEEEDTSPYLEEGKLELEERMEEDGNIVESVAGEIENVRDKERVCGLEEEEGNWSPKTEIKDDHGGSAEMAACSREVAGGLGALGCAELPTLTGDE